MQAKAVEVSLMGAAEAKVTATESLSVSIKAPVTFATAEVRIRLEAIDGF